MSAHSSAKRLQDVFSNPVLALLLWTCAVTDRVDQQLCRLLGLRDVDLATLEAVYGEALQKLRALRICAPDCAVDELGQVLKAHLGAGLLQGMLNQRPEQMEYSARLLTRLPLWIRDPQLASLEREARVTAAEARIEEVNLRRAEAAARRQNLAAGRDSTPAASPVSAPPNNLHSAPADHRDSTPAVNHAAVPASVGRDAIPAASPVSASASTSDSALAPVGRDSVPASDYAAAEVKSTPPEVLKVLILGGKSAEEVKSATAEPTAPAPADIELAAPGLSPRPQTGAAQGRRKLPKAARKAAAAGRR